MSCGTTLRADGVDHVVLAGMGGSSLAPEVIAATYGVELTVLDTTDPGQVAAAADRPARTAPSLVVSSKSGGTLETDSHRRAYEQAFRDAGLDPAQRIVVVTDPGSPLQQTASDAGYQVFVADPNVGGRYSALTAFGLVPTGLAGVPIAELLDQAAEALRRRSPATTGNPGLDLGAALGGFGRAGHDKVVLADAGSGIVGFGDWAEQLIAESTGKSGRGLLPVVVGDTGSPGFADRADTHLGDARRHAASHRHEPSAARSARSSWSGSSPPPSPGGCWGSTRSTSPTSRSRRTTPKAVLDKAGDGPLPERRRRAFIDGAVEVHADAGPAGRRHRPRAASSRPCSPPSPTAATSR